MKIAQTLWTKPGLNAHWLDTRFHYLSWALSCLQLRKYYDQVELYTDEVGKYLLIDTFGLPYTKVHVTLEDFKYPSYLWAAPKIYTYSLQSSPFLHIDGDVFLFKKIPESFIQENDFVFQNEEIDTSRKDGFYFKMFRDLFSLKPQHEFPDWIRSIDMNKIVAFNAGILGGSNMDFFKTYTTAAFSFLDEEKSVIEKLKQPQFGTHMSEQVLPAYLKKHPGFKAAMLFEQDDLPGFLTEPTCSTFDEHNFSRVPLPYDYMRFDEFGISPYGRKYVHLTGTKKRSMLVCKQVARRLLKDYPEYYHTIIRFFNNNNHLPHPPAYTSKMADIKNNCSSFGEKRSQLKLENIFRRTLEMCTLFNLKKDSDMTGISDFRNWINSQIAQMSDEEQQLKIKDIFSFELARYEFSQKIENRQLDEMDSMQARSIDVISEEEQVLDDRIFLQTNEYIKIISTKWNWWNRDVFVNMDIQYENVNMLIYPDKITYSIVELQASDLHVKILETFFDGDSIANGFNKLQQQLVPEQSKAAFRSEFVKTVIYLITNGILFAGKINVAYTENFSGGSGVTSNS